MMQTFLGAALLVLNLWGLPAQARPTAGGLFGFSSTDDVVFWDTEAGNVRVHYSQSGPNVTVLADNDQDGFPDYVQNVGEIAEATLEVFHDELAFLSPLSDGVLATGNGGSEAFDFYLVDFDGNGDGHFGLDGCLEDSPACIGHMVVENDFAGYGYPSLLTALEVVISHEVFHGVQAAYRGDFPSWVSEGTAVWAEKQFDPNSQDFLAWASAYLEEPSRSLNNPPTGPVPAFAYGTSLFWDFLTLQHGPELIKALFERSTAPEELSDADWLVLLDEQLGGQDALLTETFTKFTQWNLATGDRAGSTESYPYAAQLHGLVIEGYGDDLDESVRLFPMASRYFRLNHQGGPLVLLFDEVTPDLFVSLHPVEGGTLDGPVLDAVAELDDLQANAPLFFANGDALNPGGYFLVVGRNGHTGQSMRVRLCAGTEEEALRCQQEKVSDPEPQETPNEPPADPEAGVLSCASSDEPWPIGGFCLLLLLMRKRRLFLLSN